jgi:recombination protein RecT
MEIEMGNDLVQFVQQQESMFVERVCDEKVKFSTESQFAIQALQGNSYLAGIAQKNMASLQNAIINVASIGISLNPANKHAYLVPREGKVCLDISYMGLLHLAMSTGSIKWGQCKLVYSNDSYESNGLDNAPSHKYNPFDDRGNVVGGYCTVKTADGDYLTEEMPVSEINAIMERSQGYKSGKSSPWRTDYNEMARKTIVKRASKYWPKVERLDNAIHHLNTDSGEGLQQEGQPQKDITPCSTLQLNQIAHELARIGRTESQLVEILIPKLIGRTIDELPDLTSDEAVKVISNLEGYQDANNS